MAHRVNVTEIQNELIDAFKFGEEKRARTLVSQLGEGREQIRTALEAMLDDSYGLARQAAAFGLGELGGTASVTRLERQLAMEEARGDYDGEAVVEDIVEALGRIDDPSAGGSLLRVLEQLGDGKLEHLNAYVLARSLWRRRHPEMLPVIRQSLGRIPPAAQPAMHGLAILLEKNAEELSAWARDLAVPVKQKTELLVVLEEEVPEELVPALPAFIAVAQNLEGMMNQVPEAEPYCERLFGLLLSGRDRFFSVLPADARATLRAAARSLIEATVPDSSLLAAGMLEVVGRAEDADFLEAHRPDSPTLAKAFDDAARALRGLQKN